MNAMYPENLRYTPTHEWAHLDGDVTVGITEFAQEELGDLVYVDLPPLGKTVSAGDLLASVESVKTVSDVYAPVAGTVIEVNARLADEPGLVNTSPYDEGWLMKLSRIELGEADHLLTADQYEHGLTSH